MMPPAQNSMPALFGLTETALQVSQFIQLCNSLFEESVVRIEGEVAGYSLSKGKFIFFDLKDEQEDARISCFMMAFHLSTPLEDGMRVVVEGRPGLYQKSGQFRVTVLRVAPTGEGSVKRAFELLKNKLEKEGLFSLERKRKLPRYVKRVGIISSSGAAGFGDFQTIALQRMSGVEFLLFDVSVQGKEAEHEICAAFEYSNGHYDLDCIALLRGGGSMEDLHAFNSEKVARAIVSSKAPVLVGVGHERDVTIADLCADVRAATPSNAAQILLPSKDEIEAEVRRTLQQGIMYLQKTINLVKERTVGRCRSISQLLSYAISEKKTRVDTLMKTISLVSPYATLRRGYTLTKTDSGHVITSAQSIKKGTLLITQFQDGTIQSITL